MKLEGFTKLWKNYIGGKMLYLGGFGLIAGITANKDTMAIVMALFVASSTITFQIERLREQIQEVPE